MRVIIIAGAARTGTHLTNSILCASPEVHPLLSETVPVRIIVEAYERAATHFKKFPGIHFDSLAEIQSLFSKTLADFVRHIGEKYQTGVCVFRAPILTKTLPEIAALLRYQGIDARFLCLVRDPRDTVLSLKEWNRKRLASEKPPIMKGRQSYPDLAHFYMSYYARLLKEKDNIQNLKFIRYESLITDTQNQVAEIAGFTGLDLSAYNPQAAWTRTEVDLSDKNPNVSECITDLYGKGISSDSLGKHKDILSPKEAVAVLKICRRILNEFYPELINQKLIEQMKDNLLEKINARTRKFRKKIFPDGRIYE